MEPKKFQGVSRRKFVKTGAGVVAAGALLGKRAFAAPRPIKIGYVTPRTGGLAPFGEADTFVFEEVRKYVQGGVKIGGTTRSVEILVRDTQSSPNRAAEVATSLIKSDQVDLILAAGTPDTVIPVSDQCEINQMPCLTTDTPWQVWYFVRGGKPDKGFDWTYHFFFGIDLVTELTCDIFDLLPTNKIVAGLWANDTDGIFESDPVHGQPAIFKQRGYTTIDPGRFDANINDFSAQISAFKKANADLVHGAVSLPVFTNFWNQVAQQGYKPKNCTFGKAILFPADVEALGPLGKYLTNEVWWSPAYPFKSSLTGQSAAQLCDAWVDRMHKQWPMLLGCRYALFEVALDTLKRAQNPESNASVNQALRATKLNTIQGPLQWEGPPPNQWVTIPNKNVCTTPIAAGQWVLGAKFMYDLAVIDNRRYPSIPVQRKIMPLQWA